MANNNKEIIISNEICGDHRITLFKRFRTYLCELTLEVPTHKTVKHPQTIRRQQPTNCLSVFEHFVGLALKGLTNLKKIHKINPF